MEAENPVPKVPLLKLRDDLQFTYQSYGNRPCYLLVDPVNEHYYQIGEAEYALLHRLNGETSLEQAITYPDADQLSLEQAMQIQQWLIFSQLAYVESEKGWQLLHPKTGLSQKLAQHSNLLFLKLPLGSPNAFLGKLLPYFRWLYTPYFWLLWFAVCGSGLYQLVSQHERVISASSQIFALHNAFWLFIAWVLIKTVHEISHGLVCKYYGGYVHQAGLFFILFAPIGGYVDATASWKFTSKWQRIHVSAAGMFIELFLAGIAAWVWTYTDTGVANYLSYNVILLASVATLLFNANPLMRFDGYYILIDLLNIPNLYGAGQRYIRYLNRRYLQGRAETPLTATPVKLLIIKIYGLAAWVWRWLIVIGISIAAMYLWAGAGVILAAIACISWFIVPLARFFTGLSKDPQRDPVLRHLSLVLGGLALGLSLLFSQVFWSQQIHVPAVFDYTHSAIIHNESAGFVKKVAVQAGDYVQAGQLLIELENTELQAETRDIEIQIAIHEAKRQKYFKEQAFGKYQEELEKLNELENKFREKAKQVQGLILVAPVAGYVIAERLRELPDAYLKRGTELLTIADPHQLEIKLSIPQQDIEAFRARVGVEVQLFRSAVPLQALAAQLVKINPSASQEIIHPALTATAGGEIPVKAKPQQDESGTTGELNQAEQPSRYEYLEPRFVGVVNVLDSAVLEKVRAGETAQVVLSSPPQSLWNLFSVAIQRYVQRLMDQNAGS